MSVEAIARCSLSYWLLAASLLLAAPAAAQDAPRVIEVAPGVHMLVGAGGNIGVASGQDQTFIIDDQYAGMTEAIVEAIAEFAAEPVTFVLNTHYHQDHTGGNEYLGEAGALILSHDNVRRRLTTEQFVAFLDSRYDAMPRAGLPVVTFDNSITLHLNGDEIRAFHVANAHTDGDAIVHFRNANVLHMGDTFFNLLYPFIDYGAGGSIEGVIAAVDRALALSDGSTKIIPGHGPLTDRQGLRVYRRLLDTVAQRIRMALAEGKSLEEVKAARPTAEFDAQWGGGFLPAERWVTMIYEGMRAQR